MLRVMPLFMFLCELGMLFTSPNLNFADKVHTGKVVSVSEDSSGGDAKLTIADHDGKDRKMFSVASTVKVTLDKKDAKLSDLKKGDSVQVTTENEGTVTAIEASREKSGA